MCLSAFPFSSELVVAMTVAPAATANCRAKMLTPPVPCVKTQSPGFRGFGPYKAFHAVNAAHESVEASGKLRFSGIRTRPLSSNTPCFRNAPSFAPPRPVWMILGVKDPARWPWLKRVQTLSPGWKLETRGPTASTVPAPSDVGMTGRFSGKGYCPYEYIIFSFELQGKGQGKLV